MTSSTDGAGSPAIAATQDAAFNMFKNTGSGTIVVMQSEVPPAKLAQAEAEIKRLQESGAGGDQQPSARVQWLAGLASLRNVGVAHRNMLSELRGDDAETTAEAKYTAWLMLAVKHIRTLPVHGPHEAWAFETLDRFPLNAAPAGDYLNTRIVEIAAMFSTHLERIEEVRKRYTLAWPNESES